MEMWLLATAAAILVLLSIWVVTLASDGESAADARAEDYEIEEEIEDMDADSDTDTDKAPEQPPEEGWVWWRDDRLVVGGLVAMAGLGLGAVLLSRPRPSVSLSNGGAVISAGYLIWRVLTSD